MPYAVALLRGTYHFIIISVHDESRTSGTNGERVVVVVDSCALVGGEIRGVVLVSRQLLS